MGSFGWRAAWVLAALAVPVAAGAQPTTPDAEVDVVIKTNLQIAPEHTEMYTSTLERYVGICLAGLTGRSAKPAPAEPQDGAAYYRLTVVHTGSVVVATASKISRAVDPDDSSIHYLLAQQKGKYEFELTRWTGTAYESADKWTSDFATSHHTVVAPGLSRAEMAKWRKIALMRAYPEAVKEGILNHLLPVRVLRTYGRAGGTQNVIVSLTNESLWPLKAAKVGVAWSDQKTREPCRYYVELNYAGLLMPGEKTRLEGAGGARRAVYHYEVAMPMEIMVMPTFDPMRGPLWVRRHVEAMKNPAAREAAARVVERSLGRFVPLEMKAAAEALIGLLAHEAPRGETDVPQDVRSLLEQIGQPAVPLLADGLAHANPGIRLGAACVLQKIKVTDRAVLSRLRAALKDACEPVRAAAAKALEASGVKAEAEPDAEP